MIRSVLRIAKMIVSIYVTPFVYNHSINGEVYEKPDSI